MIKAKLAAQVAQLSTDRVPFVLATVVRALRPASVQPGDTAIVLSDGSISGFVGGQCSETSVRLYSLRALKTGEPVLLRLIPDGAEVEESDGVEGAVVERNPCLSGGSLEIFLEPQIPAARLVIVGGSPVARALEQLADIAGYVVEAVAAGEMEDFGDATAVVVASHGSGEEPALTSAIAAGVPYVALVASEKRGEAVREELELAPELKPLLHTPAGVDIGAVTPAEIAISILAELIVTQRSGEDAEQADAALVAIESNGDGPAVPEPPDGAAVREGADGAAVREGADGAAVPESADAEASPAAKAVSAVASKKDGGDKAPAPSNGAPAAQVKLDKSAGSSTALSADKDGTSKLKVVDPLEALAADAASSVATATATAELGVDYAIDPVCGMKVAVSPSTLHLDVGGERVYFCGSGCRVAYAHAPDGAKI